MDKKAQLGQKIQAGLVIILIVVILFLVYAELVPEVQTAGDSLNVSNRCTQVGCAYNTTTASASGYTGNCANNLSAERTKCTDAVGDGLPLSGLFRGTGVIVLIIMVALIITTINTVMRIGKK